MLRQEVCLIDSDEENEDGNLTGIKSEISPFGEVVYLPDCPSNFQPEEEENVQIYKTPVVYIPEDSEFKTNKSILKIKETASDIKFQVGRSNLKDLKHISVNTSNSSPTSSSKSNDNSFKTNVLNSQIKRANINESPRYVIKKAKYERQATPLCDAIMREYSKRQKKLNYNKGSSELTDIQIKNILAKTKNSKVEFDKNKEPNLNSNVINKEKPEVKVYSGKPTSKDDKFNLSESQQNDNNKDPLLTSVKNIKIKSEIPVIDMDPQSPVDVICSKDSSNESSRYKTTKEKVDSSVPASSLNKLKQTDYNIGIKTLEPDKRKRGRPRKVVEEDNILKTSRITRSSKKSCPTVRYQDDSNSSSDGDRTLPSEQSIHLNKKDMLLNNDTNSKTNSMLQISEACINTGGLITNSLSSGFKRNDFDLLSSGNSGTRDHEFTLPKPEAVSLAIRLKLLVDKIADALTNEVSPNILSDAQKLLQATKELFKLQSVGQILPTESQTEREVKRTNKYILRKTNGLQSNGTDLKILTHDLSFHDKCAIVLNYFMSYKEVFNSHVVNNMIPVLSEVMLLCLDQTAECLERRKQAESRGHTEIVQQEILFYSKLMSNCSDKFFPWFNLIVNKLIKTAASKAGMVTLIALITGSLLIKDSKCKSKFQEVSKVLIDMSKAHKYTDPLLWQVLQMPQQVYYEEVKLVIRMLKYFRQRQLISLSVELISNMEKALLVENFVFDNAHQNYTKEIHESSLVEQNPSASNNSSNLSNIAVQFVETLQTERQCVSNIVEGKVNHILSVLSRNNDDESDIATGEAVEQVFREREANNICNNTSGNTLYSSDGNKQMLNNSGEIEARGLMLVQLFKSDKSGLDSIFSSNNKDTKNNKLQVETEPVNNSEVSLTKSSRSSESELEFINIVNIKQEPEERDGEEMFPITSVWTNPSESLLNSSVSSTILQDICEIEDNSEFKQEPSTF